METASPAEDTHLRAQPAKTLIRGSPKANHRPHRFENFVSRRLTLGCERCHWRNAVNKSHDAACRQRMTSLLCQPNEVQEKPEERVTLAAMDTGPKPGSSSSAAADMKIQLPATDKRAVGTVDDSAMEKTAIKRASVPGTLGGMEVCVQLRTTGSIYLDRCWKIKRIVKMVMWIAEACLNTSTECRSAHLVRKNSSPKKQVYATRSGEPMCHDAAKQSTRQGTEAHAGPQCV